MEMCKLCQDKYHRLEKQDKPIDDLEIYRAAVAIFVSIYQSSASVDLLRAEAIEQARLLAKEVKGE